MFGDLRTVDCAGWSSRWTAAGMRMGKIVGLIFSECLRNDVVDVSVLYVVRTCKKLVFNDSILSRLIYTIVLMSRLTLHYRVEDVVSTNLHYRV